jgi:hypothetical protein
MFDTPLLLFVLVLLWIAEAMADQWGRIKEVA